MCFIRMEFKLIIYLFILIVHQSAAKNSKLELPNRCLVQQSGIINLKISENNTFPVYCDAELAGSGWTVIQRRKDAQGNFNPSWEEYRLGFGELDDSFFIGLDKLHLLTTSRPHELYIYLRNNGSETRFARYDNFVIGNASEQYKLKSLGTYSGTAGDSLVYHLGMKFSTYDADNDEHDSINCGAEWDSGWWFGSCYQRYVLS